MSNASYATLTRQSGLVRELRLIANNIANASTAGYRQEGLVFSEFVRRTGDQGSLSMGHGQVRNTSLQQGPLQQTGGKLDLAIEGDGFFMIRTEAGDRLTRAGSFAADAEGQMVDLAGNPVLDPNGSPLVLPPDVQTLSVAGDGTLSAAGQPLGQIGIFRPADPVGLRREGGVMFAADGGVEPVETARVLQGFVEGSNVVAVQQIARLIEVQRAYEMGQSFLEAENERVRGAVRSLLR